MCMSAAHCQGNVREFHSVWRVVTLRNLLRLVAVDIFKRRRINECTL